MAYATVGDVQQLNTARTFGASTHPRTDQVVDYLEQTAAVLDGILRSQGYALPVPTTATSALKLLEGYNALGAACKVEQGAKTSDRRSDVCKMWAEAQKMLEDGKIELEAPRDTDTAYPRHGGAATPAITRDMQF